MFLVKRDNFNKIYIIKGLIIALLFSAFIYLNYFGLEFKILNTILGLVSLYFIIKVEKKVLFFIGFFIGLLWFYWVGISFQYYDLTYLSPLIIFAFALTYGVIFHLIALYDHAIFRIIALCLLSFVQPFGFNWFIPELIFVDSYFPIGKEYFFLILSCIYMFIYLNKKIKLIAIIPLLFILTNNKTPTEEPNIDITMPQLNVTQNSKWVKGNLSNIIKNNLDLIDKAIKEKKELIILPETAFPIVLNKEDLVRNKLEEKSKYIDIIVGAIFLENKQYYNATYHFSNSNFKIAKKVVLVPFGEEIPLPTFFVNLINDTFFNGAQDYKKADKATDFLIKDIKFRNAICYEATSDEIYQNLNGVKFVVATSNNAWFTPSIEPTLQKLLLKYFSKKYNVSIFHSINGSNNYIINP